MRQEMLTKIQRPHGHPEIERTCSRCRVLAGHEQGNREICRKMFNVSRAPKLSTKKNHYFPTPFRIVRGE